MHEHYRDSIPPHVSCIDTACMRVRRLRKLRVSSPGCMQKAWRKRQALVSALRAGRHAPCLRSSPRFLRFDAQGAATAIDCSTDGFHVMKTTHNGTLSMEHGG